MTNRNLELITGVADGVNDYVVNLNYPISDYSVNHLYLIEFKNTNTDKVKLRFKDVLKREFNFFPILKNNVQELSSGDIQKNITYLLIFNGLAFKVIASSLVSDIVTPGDMFKSVYDPQGKNDNAFNVDNHTNGTSNFVYTDAERTKVGNISITQPVDLDQIEADTNANNNKVSADGSVTTHNDVSDAGSGQIITNAERNTLNSALQLVTIDETLQGDGRSINPLGILTGRVISETIVNVLSIRTDGLFFNKIDKTESFVYDVGLYKAIIKFNWSVDATNRDFQVQFEFDGKKYGKSFENPSNPMILNQRAANTSGSPAIGSDLDGAGTDRIYNFFTEIPIIISSAGLKNYKLIYRCTQSGVEANMWDSYVKIERVV